MIDYEGDEEDDEAQMVVFKCPNCGMVLFDDEADAIDFLDN
jgi:hypothetical protein